METTNTVLESPNLPTCADGEKLFIVEAQYASGVGANLVYNPTKYYFVINAENETHAVRRLQKFGWVLASSSRAFGKAATDSYPFKKLPKGENVKVIQYLKGTNA